MQPNGVSRLDMMVQMSVMTIGASDRQNIESEHVV